MRATQGQLRRHRANGQRSNGLGLGAAETTSGAGEARPTWEPPGRPCATKYKWHTCWRQLYQGRCLRLLYYNRLFISMY